LMLLAGLSLMYFQATASTSARWIIAWMLRTVLGARPRVICCGIMPDLYRRTAARAAWIVVSHASETVRAVGGFAVCDSIRPVGVHLAVAVALDPSLCEQLPVEPQELGFVEPLKAFAADPGITYGSA
jgi:hypothetical protein